MGAKVTALVRDRGRVKGVRVARNGSEQALKARLVVGADGRNSTVARLAGSRKYNLTENERFFYWSFFEGADSGAEPTVIFHRWSGNFVSAIPADSGLYLVLALPELSELPRFRQSLEECYLEYVCRCDLVAHALSDARRVGKLFGMLRWEGFFREATGPGWVLWAIPAISGTPRQARASKTRSGRSSPCGPAILGGISRSPSALDEALAGWARWRDEDARRALLARRRPRQGGLGACSAPGDRTAFVRAGQAGLVPGPVQPPLYPSKVLTPTRRRARQPACWRVGGCDRRALLGQVGALIAEDIRRKRLARYPHFVPLETSVDAGPTVVDDDDAASLR